MSRVKSSEARALRTSHNVLRSACVSVRAQQRRRRPWDQGRGRRHQSLALNPAHRGRGALHRHHKHRRRTHCSERSTRRPSLGSTARLIPPPPCASQFARTTRHAHVFAPLKSLAATHCTHGAHAPSKNLMNQAFPVQSIIGAMENLRESGFMGPVHGCDRRGRLETTTLACGSVHEPQLGAI